MFIQDGPRAQAELETGTVRTVFLGTTKQNRNRWKCVFSPMLAAARGLPRFDKLGKGLPAYHGNSCYSCQSQPVSSRHLSLVSSRMPKEYLSALARRLAREAAIFGVLGFGSPVEISESYRGKS